jgi:hypothetical protein
MLAVPPLHRRPDAASTPTHTMNNKGYSRKFAEANKKADQSHIGVQLGRVCIARDIPVPDVAEYLGVSRQVIYLWFLGKSMPHPKTRERLKELVAFFKSQPK